MNNDNSQTSTMNALVKLFSFMKNPEALRKGYLSIWYKGKGMKQQDFFECVKEDSCFNPLTEDKLKTIYKNEKHKGIKECINEFIGFRHKEGDSDTGRIVSLVNYYDPDGIIIHTYNQHEIVVSDKVWPIIRFTRCEDDYWIQNVLEVDGEWVSIEIQLPAEVVYEILKHELDIIKEERK